MYDVDRKRGDDSHDSEFNITTRYIENKLTPNSGTMWVIYNSTAEFDNESHFSGMLSCVDKSLKDPVPKKCG